ncbi:MAG: peptidoglycan-binding protein [Clostridia bacterium]|nr:peptidoglycan-binding protein [Clostridia bacterium]
MKKIIVLALALLLTFSLTTALTEGVLTSVQENFYVVGSPSLYGYLYAKVENTGDAMVRIDGGQMDILDADGEVLASSTFPNRAAEYLQPGEYTYVSFNQRIEGIENPDDVAGYTMTLKSQHDVKGMSFRLPVESVYEKDVPDGSWTRNYMTTTVTNDADQTVYGVSIGRALLDADGNIMYIDSDSMYSYKGITPGSSIVYRNTVGSYFEKYMEENNIEPAVIDAIAYANVLDPGLYTRGGVGDAEPEPAAAEDEPEAAPEAELEASAYDTLQKGSKGDAVRAMQQRLKDLDYLSGTVDGDFGKGTAKAVSAFQTNAGLEATGIADAATQEALFAEDAPGA